MTLVGGACWIKHCPDNSWFLNPAMFMAQQCDGIKYVESPVPLPGCFYLPASYVFFQLESIFFISCFDGDHGHEDSSMG